MDTKQLNYLLTIAKCQNLSAAARELQVSQPALSKYLHHLQTDLDVELFLRYNKKLIPTQEGRIYLEAARKIIDIKTSTYQSIRQLGHRSQKQLRIGASPHNGASQAAASFMQFRKQFPDTDIVIKEGYVGSLRQMLTEDIIDLALMSIDDLENPHFHFATHGKTEIFLITPKFHKMSQTASPNPYHPTVVDIRAFEDSPFILPGPATTSRRIIDDIFKKAGFAPTVVYETNNTTAVRKMVEAGVGISFVSHLTAEDAKAFAHFSIAPGYHLYLGVGWRQNRILTKEEAYYIYLSLVHGSTHFISYEPTYNLFAADIIKQMEEHYGHPDY